MTKRPNESRKRRLQRNDGRRLETEGAGRRVRRKQLSVVRAAESLQEKEDAEVQREHGGSS